MKTRICVFLLLGAGLWNCDTPEVVPFNALDESLLYRESGWVMVSEIRDNGVSKSNLFNSYAACVRDDIYRFNSDLTYAILESTMDCDTIAQPTKATGTWKLASGILTFRPSDSASHPFTIGQVSTSFNLTSLSEQQFVYTYLELETNGTVKAVTTVTLEPASPSPN